MSGSKKRDVEFRIREIPEGEDILALLGSEWIREYGYDIDSIPIDKDHYHNLLEIGVCQSPLPMERETVPK